MNVNRKKAKKPTKKSGNQRVSATAMILAQPGERRKVAYHESGHAVVALAFFQHARFVEIGHDSTDESLGSAGVGTTLPGRRSARKHVESNDGSAHSAKFSAAQVIWIALAGHIAEARATGKPLEWVLERLDSDDPDMMKAAEGIRWTLDAPRFDEWQEVWCSRKSSAAFQRAARDVDRWLAAHWSHVARLAKKLDAAGKLEGEKLQRLLDAAKVTSWHTWTESRRSQRTRVVNRGITAAGKRQMRTAKRTMSNEKMVRVKKVPLMLASPRRAR